MFKFGFMIAHVRYTAQNLLCIIDFETSSAKQTVYGHCCVLEINVTFVNHLILITNLIK